MSSRFLRNKDLIQQSKLRSVQVIGLGGTGSATVQLLAIMGFDKIIGYDGDKIEEHNFSTCIYPDYCLNSSKAEAAEKTFSSLTEGVLEMHNEYWTTQPVNPVLMLCTDNMEVRKHAYDRWKRLSRRKVLIDMRMDALSIEIITVTKNNDRYMEFWKPSAEIEDAVCTMKHTIFTGTLTASLAVNQLFCVLTDRPYYDYLWQGLVPYNIERGNLIIDN